MSDLRLVFAGLSPSWQIATVLLGGIGAVLVVAFLLFVAPELYREARDIFNTWLPPTPEPPVSDDVRRQQLDVIVQFPRRGIQ